MGGAVGSPRADQTVSLPDYTTCGWGVDLGPAPVNTSPCGMVRTAVVQGFNLGAHDSAQVHASPDVSLLTQDTCEQTYLYVWVETRDGPGSDFSNAGLTVWAGDWNTSSGFEYECFLDSGQVPVLGGPTNDFSTTGVYEARITAWVANLEAGALLPVERFTVTAGEECAHCDIDEYTAPDGQCASCPDGEFATTNNQCEPCLVDDVLSFPEFVTCGWQVQSGPTPSGPTTCDAVNTVLVDNIVDVLSSGNYTTVRIDVAVDTSDVAVDVAVDTSDVAVDVCDQTTLFVATETYDGGWGDAEVTTLQGVPGLVVGDTTPDTCSLDTHNGPEWTAEAATLDVDHLRISVWARTSDGAFLPATSRERMRLNTAGDRGSDPERPQ